MNPDAFMILCHELRECKSISCLDCGVDSNLENGETLPAACEVIADTLSVAWGSYRVAGSGASASLALRTPWIRIAAEVGGVGEAVSRVAEHVLNRDAPSAGNLRPSVRGIRGEERGGDEQPEEECYNTNWGGAENLNMAYLRIAGEFPR